MRLKIGQKIKIDYGMGHLDNTEIEVLHILKADKQVVYKRYCYRSTSWKFECHSLSFFKYLKERGYLKYV